MTHEIVFDGAVRHWDNAIAQSIYALDELRHYTAIDERDMLAIKRENSSSSKVDVDIFYLACVTVCDSDSFFLFTSCFLTFDCHEDVSTIMRESKRFCTNKRWARKPFLLLDAVIASSSFTLIFTFCRAFWKVAVKSEVLFYFCVICFFPAPLILKVLRFDF